MHALIVWGERAHIEFTPKPTQSEVLYEVMNDPRVPVELQARAAMALLPPLPEGDKQ
jgi:hypothetical protein